MSRKPVFVGVRMGGLELLDELVRVLVRAAEDPVAPHRGGIGGREGNGEGVVMDIHADVGDNLYMKAKLTFFAMLSGLLLACASHAQEPVTGVGVAIGLKDHMITIMKVLPNTPASKAGLSAGLVVQKIDGTATEGMLLKGCVEMLRGAVGAKVKLELVDAANSTTNTVELTRERIL